MIFDASSLYILMKKRDLKPLRDSRTLDLAFYEIGNSLLKELRRKLITRESFENALAVLSELGGLVSVSNFTELDADRVVKISRSTGLTFYDASYLALASMTGETLVTNDEELQKEGRKLGIRASEV